MCGITGFISNSPIADASIRLKKMSDAISHRGPNGETYYTSPSALAYFGHRRLCVIDTSEAAGQPLHYNDRFTIMHNGEIYNHIELRADLEKKGFVFRSKSDTEVIVAAYQCYGKECLGFLDGMFAFVIWDEQEKIFFMARDRFGEKPLFFHYNQQHQLLLFGSEMKALWAAGVEKKLNNRLLHQFLALGYKNEVENSNTYYETIFQLPPAHFGIYNACESREMEICCYWDLNKEQYIDTSIANAIGKLNELLTSSVEKRLRADVPIGINLSGGLDSSSLLAILSGRLQKKMPCFTIDFPEFKSEKEYVQLLQNHFPNTHYFTTATATDFIRDFERLIYHQEQPFSSASVYAQFRLFELASEVNVTVLIDGQGADEILAGYKKYTYPFLLETRKKKGNKEFLEQKNALNKNDPSVVWSAKEKLAAAFPYQASRYLARKERNSLKNGSVFTKEFKESSNDDKSIYKPVVETLNDALYYNTRQNGLPELLRYADRNAMAHGREARFPFLDHKLVEYVFTLPAAFKINQGWTKWLLRKAIEPALPSEIVWRTNKIAFEPPQKLWMETTQVQELIELSKEKLVREKILQPDMLQKKIQPHDSYAAENYDWRYLVAGSLL